MNQNKIRKYIQNNLDSTEKRRMVEWIRKSPENQKIYNILKAEFIASTFKDVPNNNSTFFFERFKNRIKKKKLQRALYLTASFVLLISFLWTYQSSNYTNNNALEDITTNNTEAFSFITEKGDKKEVYLPDGSKIILNVDSELSYPRAFNDSIREVTLVGEACFDIKRNVTKPFIVNTNSIKIRVLGTSFNVKSYTKDEKVETTLVSGKVELIKDEEDGCKIARAIYNKMLQRGIKKETLELYFA